MFIDGRERDRERNIDVRNIYGLLLVLALTVECMYNTKSEH